MAHALHKGGFVSSTFFFEKESTIYLLLIALFGQETTKQGQQQKPNKTNVTGHVVHRPYATANRLRAKLQNSLKKQPTKQQQQQQIQ